MTIEIKLANGMEGSFETGANADEWFQRSKTVGQVKTKGKKKKKEKLSKKTGRYHVKPQQEIRVRGARANDVILDDVVEGELCVNSADSVAYIMNENENEREA